MSRFAHGSREPFMGVYHPTTETGMVHVADHHDMPGKKIWSWGWDDEGKDWRRALSDDQSAYLEVQAGLFRNQETYAFLEPQQLLRFRETYQPVRRIGGYSRANDEGVVHVRRGEANALRVGLNVTRAVRGGRVLVRDGRATVREEVLSLEPSGAFDRAYPDLVAAGPYTVEVRDGKGRVLLARTEGRYDVVPKAEVKTGPQPAHIFPAGEEERGRLDRPRPPPGAEREAPGPRRLRGVAGDPTARSSSGRRGASPSSSSATTKPWSRSAEGRGTPGATTPRPSTTSASPTPPSARRRRLALPGTRRRRSRPGAPRLFCNSDVSPPARGQILNLIMTRSNASLQDPTPGKVCGWSGWRSRRHRR